MAELVNIRLNRRSVRFIRTLSKNDKTKVYKRLEQVFNRQALLVAGHISKTMLSGQRLNRRTGTLARSMTGRGVRYRGIPGMRVGIFRGPAVHYAAIQEYGGVIRAKNKALAIPSEGGPALTPAGVERYQGPRNFPRPLKFIPSKKPNVVGILADTRAGAQNRDASGRFSGGRRTNLARGGQRRDARGRFSGGHSIVPVYILMRKVEIKGKHFLRDGMREKLSDVGEAIQQEITAIMLGREKKQR